MSKKAFPPTVVISPAEMAKLELHAYSNLQAEVGGMLVGSVVAGKTAIVGSIPALAAAAEQVSLTFTHEVWDDILKTAAKDFPGTVIVGWYHTHPSFGLFLSQYDSFIQDNFFKEQGQVALVIDPIAGNLAWFAHDKPGSIVKFNEAKTATGPTQKPEFVLPLQRSRTRITIAIAAVAILSAALGWGVAKMTSPSDSTQALIEARVTNTDLQGQFSNYRSQIGEALAQPVLFYTVAEGQTLESISTQFYGNFDFVELLQEINGLTPEDLLTTGQIIMVAYVEGVTVSDQAARIIAPRSTPTPTPFATPSVTPSSSPEPSPSPR
jgi:proteasome lid subunit RPN8/RPN11